MQSFQSFRRKVQSGTLIFLLCYLFSNAGVAQTHSQNFTHISVDQGLSSSVVLDIYQDRAGFMWFGTDDGLNRYDGYTFEYFSASEESLSGTSVNDLLEDGQGRVWVASARGLGYLQAGDYEYRSVITDINCSLIFNLDRNRLLVGTNGGLRIVSLRSNEIQLLTTDNGLPSNRIVGITRDGRGETWVLFPGGLARFNSDTETIENYRAVPPPADRQHGWKDLSVDSQNKFWLVSDQHLVAYDAQQNLIVRTIPIQAAATAATSNRTFFVANAEGGAWVGTDRGLFILNDTTYELRQHLKGDNQHGINNNEIRCFYTSSQGDTWLGTYGGGVNFHSRYNSRFDRFSQELNGTSTFASTIVSGFAEDDDGRLWLSTWGDGLKYFDKAQQHHQAYEFADGSFRNEIFRSVSAQDDVVWATTNNNGLVYLRPDSDQYRHFLRSNSQLVSDNLYCTHVGLGRLWLGLGGGGEGLQRFVPEKEDFATDSVRSPLTQQLIRYVRVIADDGDRRLFLGTHGQGLWIYSPEEGQVQHYTARADGQRRLSNDVVYALHYDPAGHLWVGTMVGGLNLIQLESGKVITVDERHGLPNNCINGILPDDAGNLWLSTNKGLSKFTPPDYLFSDTVTNTYIDAALGHDNFVNFTVEDGLQSNEFKYGAAYRDTEGMLYFGGINGYNRFDPDNLLPNPLPPPVVITDIRVFDKDAWPESRRPGAIADVQGRPTAIELKHDQNLLTIDYAALNYSQSKENLYAYYLDGFDNDWRYVGSLRKASYTNLPPGNYVFRVKASNNSGVWNELGTSLQITIVPPIWARNWFQAAVVLTVVLLLFMYYRYRLGEERRKTQRMETAVKERTSELAEANLQLKDQSLEIERMWGKVHDADQQKLRFFTNISHEFRTPLTLIMSPLEDLIRGNRTAINGKETLQIIYKNARRLLHLINELLDLQTLDSGAAQLRVQQLELTEFLRSLVANFRYQTDLKSITLITDLPQAINLWLDVEKMEKVIFNLLGNAFKFTDEGGRITIGARGTDQGTARITVNNTGTHIPPERLERIFERYVKSPEEHSREGSGIGLSLVRELINVHRGRIEVESSPEIGTQFAILLPLGAEAYEPGERSKSTEYSLQEATDFINEVENTTAPTILADMAENAQKDVVLIAEDDPDLRTYLTGIFEPEFTVITAADGRLALELTREHIPDFVISDFMMPEMDGLAFCQALKSDERTSHIPIIMVTARTVEEDKLAGLKVGVDDYISKPFSSAALKLKVSNILARRQAMQERLRDISQIYQVNPDNETETTFYKKLIEAIEDNLGDETFNTNALAEAMNMSRSQLYRKILAVVNRPASDLIREIRMKHAESRLLNTDEQVSTIAYSLGFKTVSHFTKTFTATYGIPPTKFRSKHLAAR